MSWRVLSKRLSWPAGTVVDGDDLSGCNIEALVQGGHLAPVQPPAQQPVSSRHKSKTQPVDPVTAYDSAEEPEEQE